MKNRETPRPLPPETVRVTITLPERGDHVFELPDTGTGMLIHSAHQAYTGTARAAAGAKFAGGYAVGLCWEHQYADLETEVCWNGEIEEMQRDGASVLKELQRAGYTNAEVRALTTGVINAVFGMYAEETEAQEVADFGEPSADVEDTETPTSESPSSETRLGSEPSTDAAA